MPEIPGQSEGVYGSARHIDAFPEHSGLSLNEGRNPEGTLVDSQDLEQRCGVTNTRVLNILRVGGKVFYVAEIGENATFKHNGQRAYVEPGLFIIGADGLTRESTPLHRLRLGERTTFDSQTAPGNDIFRLYEANEGDRINFTITNTERHGIMLGNLAGGSEITLESLGYERPHDEQDVLAGMAAPEAAAEPEPEYTPSPEPSGDLSREVTALPARPEAPAQVERQPLRVADIFRSPRTIREALRDETMSEDDRRGLHDVLRAWDELTQAREVNALWAELVEPHLRDLKASLPEARQGVDRVSAQITTLHSALVGYANDPGFEELKGWAARGMHVSMGEEGYSKIAVGLGILAPTGAIQAELSNAPFLDGLERAKRGIVGANTEHVARMRRVIDEHGDPSKYTDTQLQALCEQADVINATKLEDITAVLRTRLGAEPGADRREARVRALDTLTTLVERTADSGQAITREAAAKFATNMALIQRAIEERFLTAGVGGQYIESHRQFANALAAINEVSTQGDLARLRLTLQTLQQEVEQPASALVA